MKIANKIQKFCKVKSNKNTLVFRVLLLISAGIGFYSFAVTPYTGDIQVFMAGVNQVKYQNSSGLQALFEAWDMKGIINRLIFYIVYRCTLIFVEYGNIYKFMVVSKAIYGIFAIIIIGVSAWLLPAKKSDKIKFGFISYFSVFATFTASQLQAEMSVVILGILVFSLLLGESSKRLIVGGGDWFLIYVYKEYFSLNIFFCIMLRCISKRKN